ncbi:MAG: CarD family transcriptional regulator [Lachnospiraceae bacterium]|nr:CarD family transcriptional regulator [Lachnospiraceae bacterium]
MFKVGEYIICGNNGICQVEDITTLNIEGVDKSRKYYLLKPVFSNRSTVYRPIDLKDDTLRKAMGKEEAEELISEIPGIETIPIADEKTLEQTYKDLMHTCDPKCIVALIKTIYLRKQKRLLKGFKVTALDSRYFKQAEDFLYGELSVALDIPKNEVKDHLLTTLDRT